jgi:ABC-type sugar transport system ATPase subunit
MAGLIGAGRSETALGIFGSPPADHGEVFLRGSKVHFRQPKDAVMAGIAYLPEDRKMMGLILGGSVGTNISGAALRSVARGPFVDRSAENRLIGKYVSRLRVRTPSFQQRTGLLSGGNQQKVLLAKWLAVQPAVLIVDEPTRGVDIGTKAEIYTLFDELVREGIAILVISSDLPEVLALADRILIMRHGRVSGELARSDATEEKVMHRGNWDRNGFRGDRWPDREIVNDLYFGDSDSLTASTRVLAKLSTFLSTTKAVTASLSACWKAAGAASPWTQLGSSLSLENEAIDH